MSALTKIDMNVSVSLNQLREAVTLLNQHQPDTALDMVIHEEPQPIKGWLGANWKEGVHIELKNTGTAGTIGIRVLDKDNVRIKPATAGKLGSIEIVGDHIYIDKALGRNGCRLTAACGTVVGMAALKRQGHHVQLKGLNQKTNQFETVLEGV